MSKKRKKTSAGGAIKNLVPGKKKKCKTFVLPEGYTMDSFVRKIDGLVNNSEYFSEAMPSKKRKETLNKNTFDLSEKGGNHNCFVVPNDSTLDSFVRNIENFIPNEKNGMDMGSPKLKEKIIHSDSDLDSAKMFGDEKSTECETVNSIDQEINGSFEVPMVQSTDDTVTVNENLSSLTSISTIIDNNFCKELESIHRTEGKKPSDDNSSKVTYQQLVNENLELKRQIEIYRSDWMPKPVGSASTYFIEMGRRLSSNRNIEQAAHERKIADISSILKLSAGQLKKCQHETDITKTCRNITKYLFPNIRKRAKMLVTSMNTTTLEAIRDYAKLMHPNQSNTSTNQLNNAIGNVFGAEKYKQNKKAKKT
ncbi:unnamed protein product [Rotaria magnacalcarata]|uniref:Uncharacterized protein n=1 Tax=Rotaria magnacalcarata TaxID=392030 RepID=A0A815RW28_9BILA|nr:unnamed protein product [Rotaria magnacalcarata]CAF4022641.1 unnamed protein product [Rotaria magnacalcarata]CAF4203319.1 unnamed protein product [Rotaria magnacalcarata]CAF4219533.1 unnamed protein product [Rotaria magnacalcarata]